MRIVGMRRLVFFGGCCCCGRKLFLPMVHERALRNTKPFSLSLEIFFDILIQGFFS